MKKINTILRVSILVLGAFVTQANSKSMANPTNLESLKSLEDLENPTNLENLEDQINLKNINDNADFGAYTSSFDEWFLVGHLRKHYWKGPEDENK